MNLKDITTEAPGGNPPTSPGKVPMGKPNDDLDLTGKAPYGGPGSGNPANDAEKNLIPDPKQDITAQEITKMRPAIQIVMPDLSQQDLNVLLRTLRKLMMGQSISAKEELAVLKKYSIETSLSVIRAAGTGGGRRQATLKKSIMGQESIQQDIEEGLGYAMPGQEEDSETVTYSKTKKQGDSSVTVSANADSMDELHDILRLAGIDFEKSGDVDPTPDHKELDDEEPCSQDDDFDSNDHEDKDDVMVISPADASMSTDKEVLTNFLKDKLKKSIS